jgi:hypothetical protein
MRLHLVPGEAIEDMDNRVRDPHLKLQCLVLWTHWLLVAARDCDTDAPRRNAYMLQVDCQYQGGGDGGEMEDETKGKIR